MENKEELALEEFMDQLRGLAYYWSRVDCTELERCEGLLHSILVNIDGGGAFNPIDIVMEVDDEKLVINSTVQMHELLWKNK